MRAKISLLGQLAAAFSGLVLLVTALLTGLAVHAFAASTFAAEQQRALDAVEGAEASLAAAMTAPRFDAGTVAKELGATAGGSLVWIDEGGQVRAGALPSPGLPAEVRDAVVPVALFTAQGSSWAVYASAPLIGPKGPDGEVVLVRSLSPVLGQLRAVQRLLWLLGGALALLGGLSAFLFAESIARPIERLTRAVLRMEAGELRQSVPAAGGRETAALAAAFNRMAARVAALDDQRRAFIAAAAHELRTPLASLHALAEGLLAERGDVDPGLREDLAGMVQETERLGRLVENLLLLARLDSPEMHLANEPLRVADLLRQALWVVSPLAAERGVHLERTMPAAETWVEGDPDWLHRALVNVLDNAIRYTPQGGTVRVECSGEDAAGTVAITVTDGGSGVPQEHLARLGQRFYRVDRSRGRDTGGSGLGLAIVTDILCRHGGTVSFANAEAGGLRVTLVLPGPASRGAVTVP